MLLLVGLGFYLSRCISPFPALLLALAACGGGGTGGSTGDIAVHANCGSAGIVVFFQNGDGTFTDVQPAGADHLAAGTDVTGDGVPDVVTASPLRQHNQPLT